MVLQMYTIHLTNGEQIIASEPYDLTGPECLIDKYFASDDNTSFCVGDDFEGYHYFKGKDIVQICTGGVKKVDDIDWKIACKMLNRGGEEE